MKKTFILVCATLFMACNNSTGTKETKETSDAAAEKIDYAYLPANHQPDYWDRGDQKNAALVLKALKDFETGDIESSLAAFADSVWWSSDNFDQKISKDTLRAMFSGYRNSLANIKIEMNDFESVISKDKKEEWVTLWYKQTTTTKQGKTDSVAMVNDAKIEKGKITALDEKSRKIPAKKM